MTERQNEDIQVPERTHDQPAEGGREQAEEAVQRTEQGNVATDGADQHVE
jgi:hypothetical protein